MTLETNPRGHCSVANLRIASIFKVLNLETNPGPLLVVWDGKDVGRHGIKVMIYYSTGSANMEVDPSAQTHPTKLMQNMIREQS